MFAKSLSVFAIMGLAAAEECTSIEHLSNECGDRADGYWWDDVYKRCELSFASQEMCDKFGGAWTPTDEGHMCGISMRPMCEGSEHHVYGENGFCYFNMSHLKEGEECQSNEQMRGHYELSDDGSRCGKSMVPECTGNGGTWNDDSCLIDLRPMNNPDMCRKRGPWEDGQSLSAPYSEWDEETKHCVFSFEHFDCVENQQGVWDAASFKCGSTQYCKPPVVVEEVPEVPADGTTDPADATTDPADGTTDPADGTTDPADGTTDPADGTTDPADGTTDPADGTTEPADGTTDPADATTEPAENTVDPTEDATVQLKTASEQSTKSDNGSGFYAGFGTGLVSIGAILGFYELTRAKRTLKQAALQEPLI